MTTCKLNKKYIKYTAITFFIFSIAIIVMSGNLVSLKPAYAVTPPTPPFTQCPPVGADDSCAILIVINPDGTVNVYADPSQVPYDNNRPPTWPSIGSEDTLVGVQNNYPGPVPKITISGSDVFAFDGDGLCAFDVYPQPAYGCPNDSTGYAGPNTSFTVVDNSNGDIVFTGGLASGGSAFFSLEGPLDAASVTVTPLPPPALQGFMTGGGSIIDPTGTPNTRVTHGFVLNCDVTKTPNNLEINWDKGNKFHLDTLTTAECTKNPAIDSGNPKALFNTFHGTGTGKLNGVAGATIEFTFTDAGEPGKFDTAMIKINGGSTLSVSGNLKNGNHQAH